MFDEVVVLIKNKLNTFLHAYIEENASGQGSGEYVAFLDGEKMDPLVFPLNKITPILINIEEEKILRMGDRYEGVLENGKRIGKQPAIRLNLQVLFVSRFSNYEQSLKFLSLIVKYFQANPVLWRNNSEEDPNDMLKIELITLPINQQNELWNSLRSTYLPSVLYRISVLVYRDETIEDYDQTQQIVLGVRGKPQTPGETVILERAEAERILGAGKEPANE